MITHSQARNLAESRWGRGGTSSETTGHPGIFYFSCSSHGGFIIDGKAYHLQGLQPQTVTAIVGKTGKVLKVRAPESRRTLGYYPSLGQTCIDGYPVYYAEEDCDWCHPVLEIPTLWPHQKENARQTFWNWFDPTNPVVAERQRRDRARAAHDPDLIVWATREEIGTADGAIHPTPPGYTGANPWRSAYA